MLSIFGLPTLMAMANTTISLVRCRAIMINLPIRFRHIRLMEHICGLSIWDQTYGFAEVRMIKCWLTISTAMVRLRLCSVLVRVLASGIRRQTTSDYILSRVASLISMAMASPTIKTSKSAILLSISR